MDSISKLDDLTHNPKLTELLKRLASSDNFPNLLFYGVPGVGKYTRIKCFLREHFDECVEKVKMETREYKVQTKNININILRSIQHIEINPSDVGVYDRIIVQNVIKELAETRTFTKFKLKIVVIKQADKLTKQAQQALRRTMEKYSNSCRIILCCDSLSNIISPLRSRCLNIRVPAPSRDELTKILGKEVDGIHGNIRRAKLGLGPLEWELYIERLAKDVKAGKNLLELREYLYELLTTGIPDDIIFRTLTSELVKIYSEKADIVTYGAHYQHHSIQGQKPIYHLEAFIAKIQTLTT